MSRTVLFIGLLMIPGCASAQPAAQRTFAADVDALVTRVMALQPAPGFAVTVVKGDRTILAKGYGLADIERKVPVTANTGFYIASTTKAFTALNVALMAHRGALSLEDPISKYLGDVTWAAGVNPDSITIRQLLSHTHGVTNNGPVVWRTAFSGVHTNALLKELLRYHGPSEGRGYRYTNVGYNIAGLIIDDLTRSRWQDQLAANIFAPLGMNNTSAYVSRFDSASLAMPYGTEPTGPRRLHYAKGDGNMQAAGGLVSTAADLAKWMRMQINLGAVDGRQIFPRDVVAETQKLQVMFERPTASGSIGYTLGWNVAIVHGDTVLHHGGGFSAFRSYIAFSPTSRIGVAIMTNEGMGGAAGDFIIDQVLDYDRDPANWHARTDSGLTQLAARMQQGRERIAEDRAGRAARSQTLLHPLATYAGTYEHPEIGTMVWTVRDGKLWAEVGLLKAVAEVFDSATNKLRVELEPGSGSVIGFDVENGRAGSLTYAGRKLVRRE